MQRDATKSTTIIIIGNRHQQDINNNENNNSNRLVSPATRANSSNNNNKQLMRECLHEDDISLANYHSNAFVGRHRAGRRRSSGSYSTSSDFVSGTDRSSLASPVACAVGSISGGDSPTPFSKHLHSSWPSLSHQARALTRATYQECTSSISSSASDRSSYAASLGGGDDDRRSVDSSQQQHLLLRFHRNRNGQSGTRKLSGVVSYHYARGGPIKPSGRLNSDNYDYAHDETNIDHCATDDDDDGDGGDDDDGDAGHDCTTIKRGRRCSRADKLTTDDAQTFRSERRRRRNAFNHNSCSCSKPANQFITNKGDNNNFHNTYIITNNDDNNNNNNNISETSTRITSGAGSESLLDGETDLGNVSVGAASADVCEQRQQRGDLACVGGVGVPQARLCGACHRLRRLLIRRGRLHRRYRHRERHRYHHRRRRRRRRENRGEYFSTVSLVVKRQSSRSSKPAAKQHLSTIMMMASRLKQQQPEQQLYHCDNNGDDTDHNANYSLAARDLGLTNYHSSCSSAATITAVNSSTQPTNQQRKTQSSSSLNNTTNIIKQPNENSENDNDETYENGKQEQEQLKFVDGAGSSWLWIWNDENRCYTTRAKTRTDDNNSTGAIKSSTTDNDDGDADDTAVADFDDDNHGEKIRLAGAPRNNLVSATNNDINSNNNNTIHYFQQASKQHQQLSVLAAGVVEDIRQDHNNNNIEDKRRQQSISEQVQQKDHKRTFGLQRDQSKISTKAKPQIENSIKRSETIQKASLLLIKNNLNQQEEQRNSRDFDQEKLERNYMKFESFKGSRFENEEISFNETLKSSLSSSLLRQTEGEELSGPEIKQSAERLMASASPRLRSAEEDQFVEIKLSDDEDNEEDLMTHYKPSDQFRVMDIILNCDRKQANCERGGLTTVAQQYYNSNNLYHQLNHSIPKIYPNNTLLVDLNKCHGNLTSILPTFASSSQQAAKDDDHGHKSTFSNFLTKFRGRRRSENQTNLDVESGRQIGATAATTNDETTTREKTVKLNYKFNMPESLLRTNIKIKLDHYDKALSILTSDIRYQLHLLLYHRVQTIWLLLSTFLCLLIPVFALANLEFMTIIGAIALWLLLQLTGALVTTKTRHQLDLMLEKSVAQANAFFMDHHLMMGVINQGGLLSSKRKLMVPMLYFDTSQCREQIESILSIGSRKDARKQQVNNNNNHNHENNIPDYSKTDSPLTKPNSAVTTTTTTPNSMALEQSQQLAKKIVLRYSQRWISQYEKRKLLFIDDERVKPRHLSTGRCLCQFIEEQLKQKQSKTVSKITPTNITAINQNSSILKDNNNSIQKLNTSHNQQKTLQKPLTISVDNLKVVAQELSNNSTPLTIVKSNGPLSGHAPTLHHHKSSFIPDTLVKGHQVIPRGVGPNDSSYFQFIIFSFAKYLQSDSDNRNEISV